MSSDTIMPTDHTAKLENDSAIVLHTATELVSGQLYDSIKSAPLVDVVEILEDDIATVPEPQTVAVELPSEDNVVNEVNGMFPLDHIISSVPEPTSGAKKLRKMLLETRELIVCPGVYDGLSARTAMELGFSAMYMVRGMEYTCYYFLNYVC